MNVTPYGKPDGSGITRLVYDGGDGGVVEVDPTIEGAPEVDGVPHGWVKYVSLPATDYVAGVLSAASDAAAAWSSAVATDGPLIDAGRDLASALGDAVTLLGEITGGKS